MATVDENDVDQTLPANLKRVLDELPLSRLCEYLARRLGQARGRRELRIVLRDGKYENGRAVVPFGDLRE